MPPRRKKKVVRRRKPRRARRVPRPILSGFPKRMMVKLRYAQPISLDSDVTGVPSVYVFRANSVFDPDFAFGGHQPMGFDEWSAVYSKYTVMSSKISVRYSPTIAGSSIPTVYGVTLSSSAVLPVYTDANGIFESKYTAGYRTVGNPAAKGSSTYAQLTKSFNAKSFFGKRNPEDGSSTSALVTANPATASYFIVWSRSINGVDPVAASFIVTIDYNVLMRDPFLLDTS